MIKEIGQGWRHGVIVLGRDDDVSVGIGNDLIGLLEDLRCLAFVLVVMVCLLQQRELDFIWICG